ncbi:cobyric acid synthase [Ectothiorhodospira variabilis]|uniref:cobyric acid synthase n=1 Tax=Ectothiorhodospira variabilis TaxID=505694 RepID=UPI001EFA3C07|nr:cobyric acid synthase [Ectothiorhodospira variabilis]MCG5494252.1 cobyric acid synthase [Ectothiorhodospira variabilis]MCG5504802.1 cobyric acid synthase [Ectothiorhodospira variabilis]MCG5507959.1 cobyric acid synthase [Ectothiorhodospira variabilis]
MTSKLNMARVLMIQGTNADVGKSLVVAGLCRAFTRRGLTVRPFKAQNMSNNAAVTVDSDAPPRADGTPVRGEIGRAQALQALACGAPNSVHMNPVLLKPQSDMDSQVVLRGRVLGTWSAAGYQTMKTDLLPAVVDSLHRLAAESDLVLIEGAGCGSERYLRARDITNMGLAEAADIPVILLGEDARGGITASVLGSHQLWTTSERARVQGYLVNRFRGDPAVFAPAAEDMTRATGWPNLGLIRWFDGAARLAQEDSLALDQQHSSSGPGLRIVVPRLPRVANFDDLDPLAAEPGVDVRWIPPGQPLPRDADVVLLPGSKATRSDLECLYREGWHHDIHTHVRHGGHVVGLCAGYQMLGRVIRDPEGIEGPAGDTPGLGLLDMETTLTGDKRLLDLDARDRLSGEALTGYEMHMGRTAGPALETPWLILEDTEGTRPEGARSANGRIMGGYVHGLFAADGFRRHWLEGLGAKTSGLNYAERVDATLNAFADQLEADLDLDRLWELAQPPGLK